MYILVLILVVIAIYFIFFVAQFSNVFVEGYAPYIATDRDTVKQIINELKVGDKPVIYELGCGRARFLRVAEKKLNSSKFIGIENLTSVYLINKLRLKLIGSRISLLKKDFFKISLRDADVVYCYLNNNTMRRLGDKFIQECRQGTQIISQSFPIPQLIPNKLITMRGKKVYFYIIK